MMSSLFNILRNIFMISCFIICFAVSVLAQVPDPGATPQPEVSDVDEITNSLPSNSLFRSSIGPGNFINLLPRCVRNAPSGILVGGANMTDDQWREKYSSRFTYCMREVLGTGTEEILDSLADYMRPAMYAIIFLATVMMGVKAIGGMFRNVKAETAIFLGRVAIVIIAFESMPAIAELFFDVTDQILIVIGNGAAATFKATSSGGFQCQGSLSGTDYGKYEWIKIYDWIDCLIGKLFGLGTSKAVMTGFTAVAGASIFAGTSGAHVGMILIGFFVTIGLFLLRIATMLVMAYGAIALMMLMLPIFMLTVFFKATESYFFNR